MKTEQAWALVDERGKIMGGDYRLAIYWTKSVAKDVLKKHPDCRLVKVIVNEVISK